MTTNLTATVAHASRPCACGGAATSGAAGCTCGGAEYGICQSQGFMRPRFFAGQLLTEDDLQQLGDYVVAKNRLHNRFLFGEGVVCGLEVTCHPCGDGQVIIHPGYALDCCGNDLTLACAQPLDINAMVAELRRKLLGFDCGDPCVDQAAMGKPANATTGATQEQQEDITRHYCLYIHYCEELTDPVAPYSTGEPCGAQVCEPTRVREGLQFELRCREAGKPPGGLFARIGECLGDLISTEKSVRDIRYFQVFARQTQMAVTAIRNNPVPQMPEPGTVQQAAGNLRTAIVELQNIESDENLRAVLDAGIDTASLVASFDLQPVGNQGALLEDDLVEAIVDARSLLIEIQNLVTPELINRVFTSPVEQASAIALIEVSSKLTRRSLDTSDPDVRFLAERAIFTSRVLRASAIELDALREWLLDRLDHSPHLTDCSLRQAVRQVMPPTPPPPSQDRLSLSDATVYTRAAASLANIFSRYLVDCLCTALNPACAPCDDPAVLLACLEVKDCEVVRICNLERTFVLSPTAVRYWTPISLLGQLIERICCPISKCPEDQQASFMSSSIPAPFDSLRERPALPSPLGELLSLLSAGLSEISGKDGALLQRIIYAAALSLGQNYADRSPDLLRPFRAFGMLNTSAPAEEPTQ